MIQTYFTLFITMMIMQPDGPSISVSKLKKTFATERACQLEAENVASELTENNVQMPFVLTCSKEVPGADV